MDRNVDLAGQAFHFRRCGQCLPTRPRAFEKARTALRRYATNPALDPSERLCQVRTRELREQLADICKAGRHAPT